MAITMINGYVSTDVTTKTSKNGTDYSYFSIAENDSKKGEDGSYKQTTIFYQCFAYGDVVNKLNKAKVKKGSGLNVVGKSSLDNYTNKNGEIITQTKLIISDFSYLPITKKKDDETNQSTTNSNNSSKNDKGAVDDDLPF